MSAVFEGYAVQVVESAEIDKERSTLPWLIFHLERFCVVGTVARVLGFVCAHVSGLQDVFEPQPRPQLWVLVKDPEAALKELDMLL